jgi:hypothetical protein
MAFSGGETYLYTPDRDYVGYGLEQPRDCWPNGAKIAVSFVLNCEWCDAMCRGCGLGAGGWGSRVVLEFLLTVVDEEGGESTLWNGDEKSIGGLHETISDRDVQVGRRDFLVESQVGRDPPTRHDTTPNTQHSLHHSTTPSLHSTLDRSSSVTVRWVLEMHSPHHTAPHVTAHRFILTFPELT